MKKRYIVNGDGLTGGQGLGVHRFAAEILKRLDSMAFENDFEIWIVVPSNKEISIKFENISVKKFGVQKSGMIGKNLWQQIVFPFFVKMSRGIGVDMTLAIPMFGCGFVAIYDCIVEKFPENYPSKRGRLMRWFYTRRVKMIARGKSEILTVSETSKKDIIDTYKIKSNRIHVIESGWEHMQDIAEEPKILQKLDLKANEYFFSLGSKYRHKNYAWIVEAAKANPESCFVVTGASFGKNEDVDDKGKLPSNIIFTGYLSDGEIKTLMKECRAFVQPSLYEGFGIPPLEAMSVGSKVLIANASCLPEIYGTAAHYLDPYHGACNIEELLSGEVSDAGEVMKRYTWQRAAERVYDLLKK